MQQDSDQAPKTDWAGLMHVLGLPSPNGPIYATPMTRSSRRISRNSRNEACSRPACRRSLAAAAPPIPSSARCCVYLGRYCGSTALTLSMHTHPLATTVLALAP